jgi:eukaryotic-like serine/threonine-protein kinase
MSTTRGQHLIGQVIGSYILEKLLGYGGTSAVFLAQNRLTSEKVAIKVFQPRSTLDKKAQKSFYQRFLREAEATSELDHPNILSIYSYGQHDGLPFIVMPYMSGGTLSEYITRHGPLPLSLAVYYLEQIASALDYAHENGRVHCDVKPQNILLENEEHIVLSDFGIVQLIEPNNHNVKQATKSPETLMGTPDYISPEQATGQLVDGRSDVYSLAVTLFFLLAGRPPFQADSSLTMALMHAYEPPPPLSAFRDDSTPEVDHVIEKALAKEPGDRYQTAGQFSTAFAEAVANTEYYIPTDSEARMQAIAASQGPKKAKTLLQSSAYSTPSSKRSATFWKIAIPVILVLAVIIGSSLSAFLVTKFHTNHVSTPKASTTQTDYLSDNTKWQVEPNYFFQGGQYHILSKPPMNFSVALYDFGSTQFTNFHITVTTSELQGTHNDGDFYGIVLRSSVDLKHYYLFEITPSSEGEYEFWRSDVPQQPLLDGLLPTNSHSFNQKYVISIEVKNNSFTFFVNNLQLGKPFIDTSKQAIRSGALGLIVEGKDTEVAFSQLYINKQ